MTIPRLILVGGFLGAGKTTLLAQAAVRLSKAGHRVGLVANDQAADLVDSEVLKIAGTSVEEVAGGCFCCRFPDMIAAFQRLAQREGADVLLGEPVGSCTDLTATVMQPLKRLHAAQFDLAPLSVLVDGNQVRVLARLRAAAEQQTAPERFPDNVLYIYEKQLEEADLIVLNKADRLAAGEEAELKAALAARFPGKPLLTMSALSGAGVDAWLRWVVEQLPADPHPAGRHVVEVDYDTYAAGEAALGWLNAAVVLLRGRSRGLAGVCGRRAGGHSSRVGRDWSGDRPHQADYRRAPCTHGRGRRRERDGQSHEQLWSRPGAGPSRSGRK